MTGEVSAADWADEQVAAARDDPAARIELVERLYHGPFGRAPRHLPYRRAAMSFMRWLQRRGVLELSGHRAGRPSSRTVELWLEFAERPAARTWYRAHNASVAAAYLEHRDLAEAENAPERFFMNVGALLG